MTRLLALLLVLLAFNVQAGNECKDGIDNDLDGLIDTADLGCRQRGKPDETNCGDGVCEGGETVASCAADCYVAPPAPLPPVEISYRLEQQIIPGIDRPVRIRAVGHGTPGGPLILISNLNHARCRNADGGYASAFGYDCPDGYAEIPLAEGMRYLTEALAALGYVVASIDSNQLMYAYDSPRSVAQTLLERSALVSAHLRLWESNPPIPADTSSVILIGHSLGGTVTMLAGQNEPSVEALYLIAPSVNAMTTDHPFGLLLSGCDEDPGTHGMPGLHLVDESLDSRAVEIQQTLLPFANHRHYNTEAIPGGTGCTVAPMRADEQRQQTAEAVSAWLQHRIPASGRVAQFDAMTMPAEPVFDGFASVTPCQGQNCEPFLSSDMSRSYYYQHQRPSWALEWDSPAVIRVPLASGSKFSFRATQSIADSRNEGEKALTVRVGNKDYPAAIAWPVTTYREPCEFSDGFWTCYSWGAQVPRQILHTISVPLSGEPIAEILLPGAGRIIVADFEVTD